MAKTSSIQKNEKRKKIVAKFAKKRALLLKERADLILKGGYHAFPEEFQENARKIAALPRDSAPTRVRNRCFLTGRPRGYCRISQMCRHMTRKHALEGYLPGMRMSSW